MATERRSEWHERIKAVGREYEVARHAVDVYIAALQQGGAELPANTKRRDADTMSDNLEGTYLIRLFAAFETGLRSYWRSVKGTVPPAKDLIAAIATRHGVPDEWQEEVHRVREYRNSLVHESEEDVEPVALAAAQCSLSRFFSRLRAERDV